MPKNSEIALNFEAWILQKFSLPPTIVGVLTQSYIKNGGGKIRLHKTLTWLPSGKSVLMKYWEVFLGFWAK